MERDSADILIDPVPPPADARLVYGPEPKQFGDLRLPGSAGKAPLAVVVHGGSWKARINLIHTGHMCLALREAGIATWNVEYRSVGDVGGGWPDTGEDVAAAVAFVEQLTARYPLDPSRVVLVGHSAGGHLALVAAKRSGLPVVSLAPISDVREAAERDAPDGDAPRFMGGTPDELPERYAQASPRELLPLGVRQILIHGTADEDVPFAMSESYVGAAGGEAELVRLDGAGHFEPIDPQSREWPRTLQAVQALLGMS